MNTLIEVNLQKHRNKTEAREKENTFLEWCDRMGLSFEGYSSAVRSDKTWKSKPITFYVESYGSFQTLDGWMVYISYRADIINHVRYHSYFWDGKKCVLATHKLSEFINFHGL